MGSERWVMPLRSVALDVRAVGAKAANLSDLARAGFRVAEGFCIPVEAYQLFVRENGLVDTIRMELGRKSLDAMRWEEIWDAALRIRLAFAGATVPREIAAAVSEAYAALGDEVAVAVRSSAPAEDSAAASFAGLHESCLDIRGADATVDAVRLVWASLWSDAALLYRRELGLDPSASGMAVVVQRMVDENCSGVAFGCDPRAPAEDRAIIEAVAGSCRNLVDGLVDPERWVVERSSGKVVEWRPGESGDETAGRMLDEDDLRTLLLALQRVEERFGWPPDVEWTGRRDRLTMLQARPVTTAPGSPADERTRYLGFRPRLQALLALAEEVGSRLIPALEREGVALADEELETLDDRSLGVAITKRHAAVLRWRETYAEKFIPFAHGVRTLALYYNDAVRPDEPYEFVGLLRGLEMRASRRNEELQRLATIIAGNATLADSIRAALATAAAADWNAVAERLAPVAGGSEFAEDLENLRRRHMDVTYGGERLSERPSLILRALVEMAARPRAAPPAAESSPAELERRLFHAVGPTCRQEAEQILAIGRLSWRLRDDDNLLFGRVESQLLRALWLAAERLRAAGRLGHGTVTEKDAPLLAAALANVSQEPIHLERAAAARDGAIPEQQGTARQLVGQPAAPGLASGVARTIRSAGDLASFRAGEVLVCDAIQPSMTHLVPLAAGVVERRGGMLIHGAIIARELGIPCVNGVVDATKAIRNGDVVTVDGGLGIVTLGLPTFDMELGDAVVGG